MKVYSPNDIASLLGIKVSTLRKYSLLLEECGYEFQRNNQNQRWYRDEDVTVVKKFITFKNNGDMSLKECAEAVCMWNKGGDVTLPSTVTDNAMQRHDGDMTEIKELILKQQEMLEGQSELIKELTKRLDQQEYYIDTRLNERDQVLMETLNKTIETQKQLAAGQEKKSFWSKFRRNSN